MGRKNKTKKSKGSKPSVSIMKNAKPKTVHHDFHSTLLSGPTVEISKPSGIVDCNKMGALRVKTRGLLNVGLQWSATPGYYGILAGDNKRVLGPSEIGLFTGAMADMYTWYRYRSLKMVYVPSVPVTYSGMLAFAIIDDAGFGYANGPNSFDQLSFIANQTMTSIAEPTALTYRYDGPRVWSTKTDGHTDLSETHQCVLFGLGEGLKDPTANNYYGQLGRIYFEVDVEYYEPNCSLGTPALASKLQSSVVRQNVPVSLSFMDELNQLTKGGATSKPDVDAPRSGKDEAPPVAPVGGRWFAK